MCYLNFLVLSLFFINSLACNRDEDCWLNGVCQNKQCICDPGWRGENCSLLNLQPAPNVGAYGFSPNVTSWGGVPIRIDNLYHIYVAEMVDGCGLCRWGSNSRVVHATSNNLLGPYLFRDQALPVWSHNPQVAVDYSGPTPTYLIFHIGDASGGRPFNCNNRTVNHEENVSKQQKSSILHISKSPDGPWEAQNPPGLGSCNNPAPYIFPNGTIHLICAQPWHAFAADSWKSTWKQLPFNFLGDAGGGSWEDPFIWRDQRNNWKMLSHVYVGTGPHYADRVGGFAYSRDGLNWYRSPVPPFDNKILHVDGTTRAYTTRERPKLFFEKGSYVPLALFNGVGGVPGGDKDKCGIDWSFTISQPVGK